MRRLIMPRHYRDIVWVSLAFAALFAARHLIAEPVRPAAAIPYTVYDGYFVSNQFEPKSADSFLIIQEQPAFDRVFGVAAVMFDRSRRLEPSVFRDKIVVAAIHRGHADIRYRVVGLTRDGMTLRLSYNTSAHQTPSTEYACPLILSTPRGDYSAVAFIENGKVVKTVPVETASR